MRKLPTLYIVQVASFGGPKLGLPEDSEGAWIDHEVYLDRDEAEARAHLHETAARADARTDVVTASRVITLDELHAEFGSERSNLFLTMYRSRINELTKDVPET